MFAVFQELVYIVLSLPGCLLKPNQQQCLQSFIQNHALWIGTMQMNWSNNPLKYIIQKSVKTVGYINLGINGIMFATVNACGNNLALMYVFLLF